MEIRENSAQSPERVWVIGKVLCTKELVWIFGGRTEALAGDGQEIENERDPSQVEPPLLRRWGEDPAASLGTQLSLIVPSGSL